MKFLKKLLSYPLTIIFYFFLRTYTYYFSAYTMAEFKTWRI
jgi:hypothetical protein